MIDCNGNNYQFLTRSTSDNDMISTVNKRGNMKQCLNITYYEYEFYCLLLTLLSAYCT